MKRLCLRVNTLQCINREIWPPGAQHRDITLFILLTAHHNTCPQHCFLLLQLLLSVKIGKTKVNREQGTLFRNTQCVNMWYRFTAIKHVKGKNEVWILYNKDS